MSGPGTGRYARARRRGDARGVGAEGEPDGTFGILDLLKVAGFDPTSRAKLVRHQEGRYPVQELLRHQWLDLYQAYQGRPRFRGLDYVLSFYALPRGTRAVFYGAYRVLDERPASEGPIPATCPWSRQWQQACKFFYGLQRDPRFDGLRDRVIIDWGRATRAWVQRLANKPVLEVLEPGRRLPPFEDYLEFSLTYPQLCDLFAQEDAHREWRARLSAVAGVYLILAETNGDLYVGSASGEEGVWGRWRHYAQSGHGGNMRLRDLLRQDADYPEKFRFSLLQILPKTMARDEVLRRETVYKNKLGSRAIGLNEN